MSKVLHYCPASTVAHGGTGATMEAGARVRTDDGAEGVLERFRGRDAQVALDGGKKVWRKTESLVLATDGARRASSAGNLAFYRKGSLRKNTLGRKASAMARPASASLAPARGPYVSLTAASKMASAGGRARPWRPSATP